MVKKVETVKEVLPENIETTDKKLLSLVARSPILNDAIAEQERIEALEDTTLIIGYQSYLAPYRKRDWYGTKLEFIDQYPIVEIPDKWPN